MSDLILSFYNENNYQLQIKPGFEEFNAIM